MPTGDAGETAEAWSPRRHSRHSQRNILYVSTPAYWLTWWLVFTAHLFTAVFVSCAAFVHLLLSVPRVHHNTSALLVPIEIKRVSGIAYLVIALMHFVAVTNMLIGSIRQQRLTMRYRRPGTSMRQPTGVHVNALKPPARPRGLVRGVLRKATRLWHAVFGPSGFLSIDGSFFIPLLIVREITEIIMQSYQLWTLSYSVSRAWINRMAVGSVVANCWSFSVINALIPTRKGRHRLLLLVVDMYLDFLCTVVVPVCVILPYLLVFDWEKNGYPIELLLDDIWFTNAIAEATQVLVTSYADFFSSLLPQYGMFSCLRLIKRMVKRAHLPRHEVHRGAIVPHLSIGATAAFVPAGTESPAKEVQVRLVTAPEQPHRESRGVVIASTCISLWGFVVLAFHIHAVGFVDSPSYPGCTLYVQPWLATNTSCVVQHINCYRLGINGSSDEVTEIFSHLERPVVTKLVFEHCPSVHVPSYMSHFHSLRVLEFFNCSLVDWSLEASITSRIYPAFTTFIADRTQVDTIPRAFLHGDFPASLAVMMFINSSLFTLPENLSKLWGQSRFNRLGLEGTLVQRVPRFPFGVPFRKLWMTSNMITEFSDDAFNLASFDSIRVSGNPLQRLPFTVGDTSGLKELFVEHTNVSDVPQWVWSWLRAVDAQSATAKAVVVSFYGSPVCDAGTLNSTMKVRMCSVDLETRFGSVPYNHVKDKHPL